jgi:hypothetical protein
MTLIDVIGLILCNALSVTGIIAIVTYIVLKIVKGSDTDER